MEPAVLPLPPVRIVAEVDADLRTIRGTMTVPAGARLVDPLALLPDPKDDLQGMRTFPGAASHGQITWSAAADGTLSFETRLPRRYGTIGATGHGLFASGGWYPQPADLPIAAWDVTVALPPGTGGALGDVADTDVLHWVGTGERAGLAVVRRPTFTPLDAGPSDVLLLAQGHPPRVLVRELGAQLALMPTALSGIVVRAPLRRRLTGHAPGLAFVSDRAFRLTPGLAFVHRKAVARGIAAAFVSPADPFDRELAAAALGEVQAERLRGLDADRLLGLFRWVPQVDALLSSERMAFYGEILDRPWPTDPVKDDLVEILAPHAPGTAVLMELDDTFGPGTGQRVGEALARGDTVREALVAAGIDPVFLDPWRSAPAPQDYLLHTGDGAPAVERIGSARPETLVVRIDGVDHPLRLAPGTTALPDDARQIVLDPSLHTDQTSRRGDTWPARYSWTASGWIETVNLSQLQLYASGTLTLRRQYDTRNLWLGSVSNSRSDLVSVDVGFVRKEGPLLDGWTRPHRFRVDLGASVLNPGFADTDGVRVALDSVLSWARDDRVSSDFPVRGRRLSAAVSGGGIPATPSSWVGANVAAIGVGSFHPRFAVAARATAAVARSPLPHRLLILGGAGAMRSIPALPACPAVDGDGEPTPCLAVATERAVFATELRWAPIRGVSLPMILAWGSELQLTGGLEAMSARVDGELAWATGVTAGVFALGDVLGIDASGVGLTAAWPLAVQRVPVERSAVPELYLRFAQAF